MLEPLLPIISSSGRLRPPKQRRDEPLRPNRDRLPRATSAMSTSTAAVLPAEQPGVSVVIAAHDEAAVIERTLASILASQLDRPLQVIVVANGCTDDTAAKARSFGAAVEVIETPLGNKIHALNLGDAAARYFPRAYLDADVELTTNALAKVVQTFEKHPSCHLAAPRAQHVYGGSNPFLAGYYKLWRSMPYVREGVMG